MIRLRRRFRLRTLMIAVAIASLFCAGVSAKIRWGRYRQLAIVESRVRKECLIRADLFGDRITSTREWSGCKAPFEKVPKEFRIPEFRRETAYWSERASEHARLQKVYETSW